MNTLIAGHQRPLFSNDALRLVAAMRALDLEGELFWHDADGQSTSRGIQKKLEIIQHSGSFKLAKRPHRQTAFSLLSIVFPFRMSRKTEIIVPNMKETNVKAYIKEMVAEFPDVLEIWHDNSAALKRALNMADAKPIIVEAYKILCDWYVELSHVCREKKPVRQRAGAIRNILTKWQKSNKPFYWLEQELLRMIFRDPKIFLLSSFDLFQEYDFKDCNGFNLGEWNGLPVRSNKVFANSFPSPGMEDLYIWLRQNGQLVTGGLSYREQILQNLHEQTTQSLHPEVNVNFDSVGILSQLGALPDMTMLLAKNLKHVPEDVETILTPILSWELVRQFQTTELSTMDLFVFGGHAAIELAIETAEVKIIE